ncbi:uncharacterized protein LOC116263553 [Nymphaea colorata]|nr:uncharacterized protein LOC116263553 [Nymphaea colorata]
MAAFCIPQPTATTPAATTFTTRFVNHTDRAIDLQIRVGSTLKRSYTVQPGCSKKLGSKHIYNTYNMPNGAAMVMTFHRNEIFQPYIWIHDSSDYTKMVKQQYVSLEDMRSHSEIRICRNHRKGTIQVHKKARVDFF